MKFQLKKLSYNYETWRGKQKLKWPNKWKIQQLIKTELKYALFSLSPVPELRWSKYLEPMPSSADISMSGAVLKIFNIQFEDEGIYECEAENYRGKDKHSAKVYVQGK